MMSAEAEPSGPRLFIGVGCRRDCDAEAIRAVINAACANLELADAAGLFTVEGKHREAGLHEAARTLGLSLGFLPADTLAAMAGRTTHRSARVLAATGTPSVAEAAALAAAGPGGRLLVPRLAHATATCAVAIRPGEGA
ncbi:cobalamin biosynthesis protein [Lichenihabitans sp. Uapishka_5]|uniref:cobalamin biosynthesis protein n=1 Tax=Lichenihabitans sp. Uapishka_5 TaxID=3037302 RepID=UPI0029E7E6D9|nr:cobalamin biosynthesis protein [Lichenihabitans sp. Uapishka_5]MDX7950679.1 cobalamin biosynthesis protein [Lichenihabitans sp. Uapishka_5]